MSSRHACRIEDCRGIEFMTPSDRKESYGCNAMAEQASPRNRDGWKNSKGAESNGDAGMRDAGKTSNVRTASSRLGITRAGSKDAVAVANGRERIGGDGSNPDGTRRVLLPLLLLHNKFRNFFGETANHASCERLADSASRQKPEPWHFKSTNE